MTPAASDRGARAPTRPWTELPDQVADYLAQSLPGTVNEIVAAMRDEIPAYREPLEGAFGEEMARSVRMVLDQFVALVRHGEDDFHAKHRLFRAFGRQQVRQGRSLEALLATYRIGARLAWRRTRDAAQRAGLDTQTMSLLAEATFAYIDELSAVSAEGFAEEQAARAGELERRRAALVRLLTAPIAPERAAVQEAAAAALWPLPSTVAVLVWDASDGEHLERRLPHAALMAAVEGVSCALLPDPNGPGRRAEIRRVVGRCSAVLGPTVAPAHCGRSLRRAMAARALVERALLPRDNLVLAEEHVAELLLHASSELLGDLSDRVLAPMAELTENARRRQSATLLAWLDHQGHVPRTARALHVHPQTVRYRLVQLRDLFGSSLEDPHFRFELLLALRGNVAPRQR